MKHACLPEIVTRLKRAHRHLASDLAMFEAGGRRFDDTQKLQAVATAVASAQREPIHDCIEHRLEGGDAAAGPALRELKQPAECL
jgi:DNA-binding FrmR family transcriptional regulator